jgi:ketosteroid isomerase-like protein
MKQSILVFAFVMVALSAAFGQTTQSDEQRIRNIVQRADTDEGAIKYTENRIFVSGLYPRPIIGKRNEEEEKIYASARETRKNPELKTEIARLVVSESKDMAYEFGKRAMSWDNKDGKRTGFESSYLRVWRKIKGEWLVEVIFARTNEPASGSEKK